MNLVSLNCEIIEADQARISVFDRGFLLGDGLFETIRVAGGEILLFEQHLDRLWEGLEFLKIDPRMDRGELAGVAAELLERLQLQSARMRITITRGVFDSGPMFPRFWGPHKSTVLITASKLPFAAVVPAPVLCSLVKEIRRDGCSPLSSRKTLNYLGSILARETAQERGCLEALLTDTRGFLSEAAMSNLFWIKNGKVFCPPDECGALKGVTAGLISTLIAVKRKAIKPRKLTVDCLPFLTNSIMGISRVTELDGIEFKPCDRSETVFSQLVDDFLSVYPIAD